MHRLIFALILLFTLFSCKKHGQDDTSTQITGWNYLGYPGFSEGEIILSKLVFNPVDGILYIAYTDGLYNQAACVKRFNGTTWSNVGRSGFSAGTAESLSFDISPSGELYVAYIDFGNSRRASVMKFNGSSWVYVGNPGFTSNVVDWPSMGISPADSQPYMVFTDNSAGSLASVMKYDGSTWVYVGNPGFSHGIMQYTSNIAFSPLNHQPYVAYQDYSYDYKLCCMTYNGASWVSVGSPGFTDYNALDVSLAFSHDGSLYAAFREGWGPAKASVMKFDGIKWVYVGPKEITPRSAYCTNLVFNPINKNPYLAYQDWSKDKRATVMSFNGTNWVQLGNIGFTPGRAENPRLAFNSLGQAFVAFADSSKTQRASVMYYTP